MRAKQDIKTALIWGMFCKFLKTQGYSPYRFLETVAKDALRKGMNSDGCKQKIEYYFQNIPEEIICSFAWQSSVEKSEFWVQMHKAWRIYYYCNIASYDRFETCLYSHKKRLAYQGFALLLMLFLSFGMVIGILVLYMP